MLVGVAAESRSEVGASDNTVSTTVVADSADVFVVEDVEPPLVCHLQEPYLTFID